MNIVEVQQCLFILKAFVEFTEIPEIEQAIDGAFDPAMAVSMAKKILKNHYIMTESEYRD